MAEADSPYKRFESFLRKLVAVPKAEIDAKAAEEKRQGRWRPLGSPNDRQAMHDRAQPH